MQVIKSWTSAMMVLYFANNIFMSLLQSLKTEAVLSVGVC